MDSTIGRRRLLRGTVLGAAALAMSWNGIRVRGEPSSPLVFHSPDLTPFVDELPRPPVVSGRELELTATTTTHRFHRDLAESPAMGYGGMSYLGPTIEHRAGTPLTVRFANNLGEHPFAADIDTTVHGVSEAFRSAPPTVLHLHGGVTPPASDGHPERLVHPGQHAEHDYPFPQQAAGLWYHDHTMGITRANVYAGLAGTVLLRDEFDTGAADNPLGLPSGEFEVPLVLQEKIFAADGRQLLRTTPVVPPGSWEGGGVGDVGVVNGKVWPNMDVARGLYRFRALNAASYSVWNLFFGNRMRFWVIGNDQGLLDAPVAVTELLLAPGERVDLLVDFSGLAPGETVELRNDLAPPFQAAVLGEVAMELFCRFRAQDRAGFAGPVPERLRGGPGMPEALPPLESPTVIRNVTVSQPYELRMPPSIMTLNNLRYSSPEIDMLRQGTVEQWNIVNVTPDPHPIHIHLVEFRVLDRTPLRTIEYQAADPQPPVGVKWTPSPDGFLGGAALPAQQWEAGWKDVVRTDGGTVTRIIVRIPTAAELGFDPDAPFSRVAGEPVSVTAPMDVPSRAGTHPVHAGSHADDLRGYVWHCHLLDHEDHDMMLRLRIVP
ncbi:multicopper oxidase family protein [Nocardia jejuensis]|uniref:multicopper oxidase family protein n=1 Tax=Nocardia jejuensis TaxID=328049 RepID=UPI000836A22A|nr:multicopper oxidase domain-containing protein [Nocardia jejuensis]